VALRACIGARSAPDRVVAGPGSLVRQDIEVGIWAVPASPGAVAHRSDASGWAVGALAEFLGSGRPVFDGLRGAEAVVADGHSPDAYWRRLRHRVGHDPLILPAVAALVFREGGELLLVKTRTWDRWMIPGGAIELGETTAEAAVRKVRAETGLTVHPYALLGAYSGERFLTRYPNGDVTQHVSLPMLCHLRGGHMHLEDGEIEDIAAFAAGSLPPMHPQWERIARDGLGQALGLIE
jgi:8-oxo-dGTP pyrophosphatase MutT (NUDIX family)